MEWNVHLKARLAISFYVLFVISLFFIRDVTTHLYVAAVVLVIALIVLPLKKMKRGLFPITIFLLFTFGGNLFFHSGRIIYSSGLLSVTDEGLFLAGVRTFRVFSMLYGAKILTGIISIDAMISAFENMLRPLERTGLPVRNFFSVTALTLKAFPVLMDYLGKTYREDAENNNIRGFRQRIRLMASLMMPVFVKTMRSPESFFETGEKEHRATNQ
ncbi:MAG TPA: energy-coupling factor transporter transmembrane component T [Thermodesulfovibrionales bacterium]|nr:energy-coupling factor transporter transmembrane component T [Thermodesulfovibrionales bacterium]